MVGMAHKLVIVFKIVTTCEVAKKAKEVAIVGEKIEEKVDEAASPLHRLSKESDDFANNNRNHDDPSVISRGRRRRRRSRNGTRQRST